MFLPVALWCPMQSVTNTIKTTHKKQERMGTNRIPKKGVEI
jgi:hypothetical protein